MMGERAEIKIFDDYIKIEDIKLCINCKNIATNSIRDWKTYRCFAPQNEKGINFVTGDKLYHFETCHSARTDYDNRINADWCGPDGDWFKQKEIVEALTFQATDLDSIPDRKSKTKRLSSDDLDNL